MHPFVGFSSLSWVPIAINLSVISIVAGCIEIALNPLFLPLPYLNLKAPDCDGCPKTGLPATRSLRYVGELSVFPLSLLSCSSIYSDKKSKPVDLSPFCFIALRYLNPFAAFCASPSEKIKHIPPRI